MVEGPLHGSAMLAAIAQAAEQHHSDVPRQVVRLTVDMMRAAPLAPLRVESTTVRSGRSIDVVDVAMYAGDQLCVRGTTLRMCTTELVVDDAGTPVRAPQPPDPGLEVVPLFAHPGAEQPASHHAIDVHADLDAGTVWFRLAVPIVEGEATSGFVALAAIAEWTCAAPSLLRATAGADRSFEDDGPHGINADTTINIHRPPSGPWLGLATTSHIGTLGAGTSSAHLFDAAGAIGFSTQSVLVRAWAAMPSAGGGTVGPPSSRGARTTSTGRPRRSACRSPPKA